MAMSGSADPVTAIVDGLAEKAKRNTDLRKIKVAFPGLTDTAALMLWDGLRANGKDVDDWLSKEAIPERGSRQAVVQRLIAEGEGPKDIGWKAFYDLVRDEADGWITIRGKRKPAPGYNDRTIRRDVMDVKLT
jgi:hypothetical protein